MKQRVAACLLIVMLLAAWPPAGAWAQANPKDTGPVVGEGVGLYTQAAAVSTVGAFDRAIGELDAAPRDSTPRQVKDLSFRRRFLELRLLMDFNAFAYDKVKLKGFRDIVDRAYEGIGVYQDITDIEKELETQVPPEVVAQRLQEMNEGLGPLLNTGVRGQMRQFLASPLPAPRKGGGPGLWDLTGSSASNSFDAVGNAAEFQSGIIRHLQSVDLGVNDIFDPNQAVYFHEIRKQMRDVVIMSAMYPPITNNTREAVAPLNELVGDYGDTLEAFTAYEFARSAGMNTDKVATELRREFDRALTMKSQLVDNHGLDTMAIKLNEVRDAHRR